MTKDVAAGITDDLRYAVRAIRKDRRGSVLILLVLTLGIGLNAAAFSILEYVVLDPFPDPVDVLRQGQ